MPITGNGWELHVVRLGLHKSGAHERTYGTYQVFRDGQKVASLSGNVCERGGPGNKIAESGKRITKGRYPLSTQFGKYRTIGFVDDQQPPGTQPMPAILLEDTEPRTGILIHPGHPPTLYISSIGCLNLTGPLDPSDDMDFFDSRSRVIALIDDLHDFAPAAFQHKTNTPIPNASAVIDGEPMNMLSSPATV